MPDYNMSDSACQARAQRTKEHDEMVQQIIVLRSRIEKLETKTESLFQLCLTLRKMSNCNRDAITTLTSMTQEHTKCLKPDS